MLKIVYWAMHIGLHKLFKVKKVYISGEEQAKGVWEDVSGEGG